MVRNIWEELGVGGGTNNKTNHQSEKSLFGAEELRRLCARISDQISRVSASLVVFIHFPEKKWDLGEMSLLRLLDSDFLALHLLD